MTGDYDRLRFASVALVSLSLSPALGSSNGGQAATECRSSKKRGHDRAKGNAVDAGGRERGKERERERERDDVQAASEQACLSFSITGTPRCSRTSTSRIAVVEMHDFHWRNSPYLRLRTIDENGQSVLRVSRSPAERVYVRSSESLSCSFHFSVTLICATLSLFPSSRFPPRCSVFTNLLSHSFSTTEFLVVSFSLSTFSFSLWCDHAHICTYLHTTFTTISFIFFSFFLRNDRCGTDQKKYEDIFLEFYSSFAYRAVLIHDMHVCIDDNRARARLYDA